MSATVTKHVLVVGAGPAGVDAARATAERGHRVEIVEASAQIGGQLRLAGMQPRRAQSPDLSGREERQFQRLGASLRLNTCPGADDIAAHPADTVLIAKGSLPDPEARQRWLPQVPRLPGLDHALRSPEEVIRREGRLGETVILQDEGGNCCGAGTAWLLAEQGKSVILVTPDPDVGKEITRTAADGALRRKLARKGVVFLTVYGIRRWHGNGATVLNLMTGPEQAVAASAPVTAKTNVAFDPFPKAFPGKASLRIGDCAAPRLAAYAFHEGRKAASGL